MQIEDSWGFEINKIGQEMDRRFSQLLGRQGLNDRDSRYYGVLLVIYNYPRLTQIKIGEKLKIDRTTIGQLIDELERKELVIREQNPKDRRQKVLILTAKGEELVKRMWLDLKKVENEVVKNLSDQQKETILAIAQLIKGDDKS